MRYLPFLPSLALLKRLITNDRNNKQFQTCHHVSCPIFVACFGFQVFGCEGAQCVDFVSQWPLLVGCVIRVEVDYMLLSRCVVCHCVIPESPQTTQLPAGSEPDCSQGGVHYFSVMWCKASKKKHKRWEGDAVLVTRGRTATLKDMEGKDIGKGEKEITFFS